MMDNFTKISLAICSAILFFTSYLAFDYAIHDVEDTFGRTILLINALFAFTAGTGLLPFLKRNSK